MDDSACSSSSGSNCNEDEREAFQKKVNLSLQKMKKRDKRLKDDDDDEALFDTVVKTYKKHCSQARAEKFSAPRVKRTEKKKAEMLGVSIRKFIAVLYLILQAPYLYVTRSFLTVFFMHMVQVNFNIWGLYIMQLTVCRMEKCKNGRFKRCSDNIKIPGFTSNDTYQVVLKKAAQAWCHESDEKSCSLIISNGRILDAPLQNDRPWSLGGFFAEIGGMQKLSRMVIGIHIPVSMQMSCSCII